jgi:hypothetical protein
VAEAISVQGYTQQARMSRVAKVDSQAAVVVVANLSWKIVWRSNFWDRKCSALIRATKKDRFPIVHYFDRRKDIAVAILLKATAGYSNLCCSVTDLIGNHKQKTIFGTMPMLNTLVPVHPGGGKQKRGKANGPQR